MINTIKQNKKAVLAFLLALVMVISIIPFTETQVQAVTIPVGDITSNNSFGNGDAWETGDKIRLLRWVDDRHTNFFLTAEVAEDGAVTWTPDKKLYWDGEEEHTLVASYPNMNLLFDNFGIPVDQSDLQKLKEADCMNAMWKGNPTTDPINLNLKHRLSMVTVTYTLASEFEPDTVITPEVYNNTQYMFFNVHTLERREVAWEEGDDAWVKPYQHKGENDEKQFTAIVSPDAYSAGDDFIRITVGDQVLTAKMQEDITFEEGKHYTFDLKVGKDVVTLIPTTNDSDFPGGWDNDEYLNSGGGIKDEGKDAWVDSDKTLVHLYSAEYGHQSSVMTFENGDWRSDGQILKYLTAENPTITAVYAPDYEIKPDGSIGLKDGKLPGMAEYIPAKTTISGSTLDIRFENGRTYSRLRIATMPGATITVKTTGFTPAGPNGTTAPESYSLTADADGNAFLYGTFATGATIEVTAEHSSYQSPIARNYTFDESSENGMSYAFAVKLGDITDAKTVFTGDIALSDGSFVSNAEIANMTDGQKAAAVGIVFWTVVETDPDGRIYPASLTDDKVMNADFPQCTHGLIVSLKNLQAMQWQSSPASVADWQGQSAEFHPSTTDYVSIAQASASAEFNRIYGYQLTKVLQAYNTYCEANGNTGNIVNPVAALGEFSASNPAPFGSTGWYLPSIKELHMLCNEDVDDIANVSGTKNRQILNSYFTVLGEDNLLEQKYWSSTEHGLNSDSSISLIFADGVEYYGNKKIENYVRFICAF